jgi:hypothetical protein
MINNLEELGKHMIGKDKLMMIYNAIIKINKY